MSKWLRTAAAAAIAIWLAPASAHQRDSGQGQPFDSAQGRPALSEVLKRSATYVEHFRKQLSAIAAEESYTQQIANTSRFVDSILMLPTRRLKSDLLLVKPSDSNRYVELRDTFEVDGKPVRNRQSRLEKLLYEPGAGDQIAGIIKESARYNIGSITRNINTPLMALQFLDRAYQQRLRFRHAGKTSPVFGKDQDPAANDAPVFRVSTEMWEIEFREQQRPTLIRAPSGDDRPAKGRFWINPVDGSVLISELIIDGGGVTATVTVSYQTEPLMGFLVPIDMRETYLGKGERITGHAEYGRFRVISK